MRHNPHWSAGARSSYGRWRVAPLLAVGAAVVAAAAGCAAGTPYGGSSATAGSNGGSSATAGSNSNATAATVSLRTVPGAGRVLVDHTGSALYVNKQETSSHLLCTTGACTTIWRPLTVAHGHMPTAAAGVSAKLGSAKLGTLQRQDGTTQVTLGGRPLYTFSFDHGAGMVTGNGVSDSFSGTSFTWRAATVGGSAAAGSSSSAGTQSNGGYNY